MTDYSRRTWSHVIMPGQGVKGGDGELWRVLSIAAKTATVSEVTVQRKHQGRVITRTKLIKSTDPVDMEVEPDDAPTPPPKNVTATDGKWEFPVMSKPEHLRSHLFIVHYSMDEGEPAEVHRKLHAGELPDQGFLHRHSEGEHHADA